MGQGSPGYPIWKRSDILNHNAFMLMCEMVDPSTSNSVRVECDATMKAKMIDKTVKDVMKDK